MIPQLNHDKFCSAIFSFIHELLILKKWKHQSSNSHNLPNCNFFLIFFQKRYLVLLLLSLLLFAFDRTHTIFKAWYTWKPFWRRFKPVYWKYLVRVPSDTKTLCSENTNQCFGCFVNFLVIFLYIWEEIVFHKRVVKFGEIRNS